MFYNKMHQSIYKNDELENEVSSDMSYFWYSEVDANINPAGQTKSNSILDTCEHEGMSLQMDEEIKWST